MVQKTGPPLKIAITAEARKFLTILNVMFRDNADHRPA
jgi:hypothetical protein